MIYSFIKRTVLFTATIYALFFVCDTGLAAGIQIDSTNYTQYLATQGGVFGVEGKNILLTSSGQSVIIVKTTEIHGMVDMVEFHDFSDTTSSVVFLWKIRGQEYAPANQMQLAVKNGIIRFPESLTLDNFDFIGLVLMSPSVRFSGMELRQENFSDKLDTFMVPELVKPSSINLLYGAKFGSTPLVMILGILSILLFFILVFINRKWAFLSVLFLWILFDLRYSYDQYSILKTTYTSFVAPSEPRDKIYYDFYNFYGFIQESKKYVHGDVNFYAPRDWPFQSNYLYHMYPLKSSWQTTDKQYYAIFQIGNVELRNGKELFIDGKLIDPNVELLYRFDENSYILKKK